MRFVPFFVLFMAAACSPSPSPMNAKDQAVVNFHGYTDPDFYCEFMDYGHALGYQTVNPWTDRLFCMNTDGIREITANKSTYYGESYSHLVYGTATAGNAPVWFARIHDDHVSIDGKLVTSCPIGKLVAVAATESEVTPAGAYIKQGLIVCMWEESLILYYDGISAPAQRNYDHFTLIE